MFRNRWIRVPLIIAVWWISWHLIIGRLSPYPISIWSTIVEGLILGISLETFGWLRIRYKYGNAGMVAREPHQHRSLMLMQEKSYAFESVTQVLETLPNVKVREADPDSSKIVARSRVNWNTFGSVFTIQLWKVGEHLTEISIDSRPVLPTIVIASGEAWKTIDEIVSEIRKLDSQPSTDALNDGAEILQDVTQRPITIGR